MSEEDSLGICFIELNCIASEPPYEVHKRALRTGEVTDFSEAPSKYIPLGGASIVAVRGGSYLVVKESYDELKALFHEIEKVTI